MKRMFLLSAFFITFSLSFACSGAMAYYPSFRLRVTPLDCPAIYSDSIRRDFTLVRDHTPRLQRRSLEQMQNQFPVFNGVYSFRQLSAALFFGSSQASEEGIETVVQLMSRGSDEPVLWINLRAEPVLFIKGQPFSLRRLDAIDENLKRTASEFTMTIDDIETSIQKQMFEAIRSGRNIDLVRDGDTGELEFFSDLTEQDVLTSAEMSRALSLRYPNLNTRRLELIDGKTLRLGDIDRLIEAIDPYLNRSIYFQCNYGFGRTTSCLIDALVLKEFSNQGTIDLSSLAKPPLAQVEALRAIPKIQNLIRMLNFSGSELNRLELLVYANRLPFDYFGNPASERLVQNYLIFLAIARYASIRSQIGVSFSEWLKAQPRLLMLF